MRRRISWFVQACCGLVCAAAWACNDQPQTEEDPYAAGAYDAGAGMKWGPDGGHNTNPNQVTLDAGVRSSSPNANGAANSGQTDTTVGSSLDAGATAQAAVAPACVGRLGQTVCDRDVMIRCSMAGTIESQMSCTSDARCRAGLATGTCGVCEPGQYRCTDSSLEKCNSSGQYEVQALCASKALCSEANRSCDPSKCTAGSYKCDGGALWKCKDDLTGFDRVQACELELCDAEAGTCHECVPDSARCEGDTLLTCSAEGTGPMAEPCGDAAPLCVKDKCVQCASDEDCTPASECSTSLCDPATGMCMDGPTKPAHSECSSGVCDGLGGCQVCIDDSDCAVTETCELFVRCTPRPALALTPAVLVDGLYTLTLNAGYDLRLSSVAYAEGATTEVVVLEGIVRRATIMPGDEDKVIISKSDQVRTFTITGAGAAYCRPTINSELEVTLRFEDTAAGTGCGDPELVLEAVK